MDERSECAGGCLLVIDLTGIGVDGVDQHSHGELAHVAVIKDAAAWRDVEGALLLLFRALSEVLVADDLEPEETAGDGADPNEEEERNDEESRALEGNAARGPRAGADVLGGRRHQLPAFSDQPSAFSFHMSGPETRADSWRLKAEDCFLVSVGGGKNVLCQRRGA